MAAADLSHAHYTVPVILVCGILLEVDIVPTDSNVLYASPILIKIMSLAEALRHTPALLETQGELLGRLLARGVIPINPSS